MSTTDGSGQRTSGTELPDGDNYPHRVGTSYQPNGYSELIPTTSTIVQLRQRLTRAFHANPPKFFAETVFAIVVAILTGLGIASLVSTHPANPVASTTRSTYPPVINPAYQAPWGIDYVKTWAYNPTAVCSEMNQRVAQLSDGPGDFAAMSDSDCGSAAYDAGFQNEVDGNMLKAPVGISYGNECLTSLERALGDIYGPTQNIVQIGQATLACYGPDSPQYRVVASTGTYYEYLPVAFDSGSGLAAGK